MSGGPHDDTKVRDRFVGFTFAAADAVMEVAGEVVVYAAGAIESLTRRSVDVLTGKSFLAVIAVPERMRVQGLLAALRRGARLSPVRVQLSTGKDVMLGACRLPDETSKSTFVTLTQVLSAPAGVAAHERDRASGTLTHSAFAAALSERIAKGADGDHLALLDLGDLMATGDAQKRRQQLATIGEILEQAAGSDGLAGRLGDSRFGVVGTKPIDEKQLAASIEGAAGDGKGKGKAKAVTIALETAGLSRADAGRAVLFAMQRFAQEETSTDGIAKLGTGLPQLLAAAAAAVSKLRETIRERRVEIALQPVVALDGGQIHHYEALCRLPDGSDPGPVIAAAEQAALAPEFDLMVAEEVFQQLAKPPIRHEIKTAVNLSGRTIEQPDVLNAIEDLLYRLRIQPGDILFEITETASITGIEKARELVKWLRERGHKICIDDVGAGAASFHYLNAFGIDFAKIDGRYIRNAATDPRDRIFLEAMIGLCRNLEVPVIAESIETADQAKDCLGLGATFGQGYLLGRPAPIRDILDA